MKPHARDSDPVYLPLADGEQDRPWSHPLRPYGVRDYGRRGCHDGQYATTEFIHWLHLPFVPGRAFWITRGPRGETHRHEIRPTLPSILRGYAAAWGPFITVGTLLTIGSVVQVSPALFAILLAGMVTTLWAWMGRRLRRGRDQRRSDLHLRAFGTRCDPLDMTQSMALALRETIGARWHAVADGKTPEDVARLGASSSEQSLVAYALLRLAARLADNHDAARALAASEALLDRMDREGTAALLGDAPYRARPL